MELNELSKNALEMLLAPFHQKLWCSKVENSTCPDLWLLFPYKLSCICTDESDGALWEIHMGIRAGALGPTIGLTIYQFPASSCGTTATLVLNSSICAIARSGEVPLATAE